MSLFTKVQRFATKRNFFLTLTITLAMFLVIALFLFPFLSLSGGLFPLDMRLAYTIDEVVQLFTALDVQGRQLYSLIQIADTVFPIALALTLIFILVMVTQRLFDPTNRIHVIIFVPLCGAIADYTENTLIATQLLSYPVLSNLIITIASVITTIKGGFMLLTFILVIILAIAALLKTR